MMRQRKSLIRITALILIVAIFFQNNAWHVLADTTEQDHEFSQQYVKEVKMFYGIDYEDAKSYAEKEGFVLCPENLMETTKSFMAAYLGYKTTTDPGEAITDLTLLDMKNSHYEESKYKEYLDKHLDDFSDMAALIMILVGEFRRQYAAGSPNALAAYDSLNNFYVDEKASPEVIENGLGYYILNKADITFFEKFIQRGHAEIFNTIVSLLGSATSDFNEDGTTWVDRAKKSAVSEMYQNADSVERNQYDTWYQDSAIDFIKKIKDFAATYAKAKELHDLYGDDFGYAETLGLPENYTVDDLRAADPNNRIPEYSGALVTYIYLDNIVYQEAQETVVTDAAYLYTEDEESEKEATVQYTERKTLAEYLIELSSDPDLSNHPERVYSFMEGMTKAQRITLKLCGLYNLAKGLYQSDSDENKRKELIREASEQLKDLGFENGKIWLWEGVDQSLYEKKVAETSEYIEAKNAGKELKNLQNEEARKAASDLTIGLRIADIVTIGTTGIIMIVQAVVGSSLLTAGLHCFAAAGLATLAGFGMGLAGALLCACWALNILLFVASIAYLIYMIMDMCGVFEEVSVVDYSTVPLILVHVRDSVSGTYRVQYESVKSNASIENVMDIFIKALEKADPKEAEEVKEKINKGDSMIWSLVVFLSFMCNPDISDFGGFQGLGDRWITLYQTKSPAAGNPIPVTEGEGFIKVQYEDYQAPEGYKALTLASSKLACDVHDIEFTNGKGTPMYVFMQRGSKAAPEEPVDPEDGKEADDPGKETDDPEKETVDPEKETDDPDKETTGPGTDTDDDTSDEPDPKTIPVEPEDDPDADLPSREKGEIVPSNQYVSRVLLSHANKKEEALDLLKKEGMTEIPDVNLTPGDGYTYIGYSLGSEKGALTDIRASASGLEKLEFGDASYGRAGIDKYGTVPNGMSIYATSVATAGSPITKITVEKKRLPLGSGAEPVCLFSGGQAVDFQHKWNDNQGLDMSTYHALLLREHFHSWQDDPVNGSYIYFWPKEQFKAKSEDDKPGYVAGFSYFLATDRDKSGDYGTNAVFMQNFAKENGFELVTENGAPMKMMSDTAGYMGPVASWKDCEGGALGHDWRYEVYHYLYYGTANNFSDGATKNHSSVGKMYEDERNQTDLYFGVSYTYNPYRAVTGISGLLSSYTETSHTLKYTGLKTPAGNMLSSNVSIMGNPVAQAGISYGYYNPVNMQNALYPNRDVKQKSEISWLSGGETEILNRYLLTAGPVLDKLPIRRDEILLTTAENPGNIANFVPVCDMRTPGDYEHPMNFALDTTNVGSKYLYIYLRNDAGGRSGEVKATQNVYTKKHYVASVFCGTGKTPEEAINALYTQAASAWSGLASMFPDINANPLVTEFDEIYPIDLSDSTPWYEEYRRDTEKVDPADDEWVYGNDAAMRRWTHETYYRSITGDHYMSDVTPDQKEILHDCAYIGVVRTNYEKQTIQKETKNDDGTTSTEEVTIRPNFGILKYYTPDDNAPSTLHVGEVVCSLAGGPVQSSEGKYYLYQSPNTSTAAFSAPITEIDLSREQFINGYNTSVSCKESDRVGFSLPSYSQLRMRPDEYMYIHTKFDLQDMPYIEHLFIGVGNSKEEAYADLIGTTNANAATLVNCNHNSFSDKWIAIGYRRTDKVEHAVRDVFLYYGDETPPNKIIVPGYSVGFTRQRGQQKTVYTPYDIEYTLIRHNLAVGAETISLNEGNGGPGLYLYYTRAAERAAYAEDLSTEIFPIRYLTFGYGDASPEVASVEDMAAIYGTTLTGMKIFDQEAFKDPNWECVLGVTGSPEEYKLDGSTGIPMSLNHGIMPMNGNQERHSGDNRVMVYVDRQSYDQLDSGELVGYTPRTNAALNGKSQYRIGMSSGILQQGN